MKEDTFNESEEDKLLDPIAESILRDFRAEVKEDDFNESEEDELLDPIANSILRDLQAEMDEAASPEGQVLVHPFTVVKDTSGVVSLVLDTGKIIKCDLKDNQVLLADEIIHCNMALQKNGDDADGQQGGQDWKPPRFDANGNPDPNGLHDENRNVARYDENGKLDPFGTFDARGDPVMFDRYNIPREDGEYSSEGTLLLYDEYGNLDPYGTYTATSRRITDSPTGSPNESPTEFPTMYPTVSPTFRPTPRGEPRRLSGTIFYDHNANGIRDSPLLTEDFGDDPEFVYGLGGVAIRIVECNSTTNREVKDVGEDKEGTEEDEDNSYATTVSRGYDGPFLNARIVPKEAEGGK